MIILRPKLDGTKDYLMLIGLLFMIFNLITCIPLSIHPCRRELYLTIFKRKVKTYEHFIITSFLLILSAVIGTAFPDVINAFSMLGGFCAVFIVIYYPGMLYLSLSPGKWASIKKIVLLIITLLLVLLGLIAAFISLFQVIGILPSD
jgi:hypothetical protein